MDLARNLGFFWPLRWRFSKRWFLTTWLLECGGEREGRESAGERAVERESRVKREGEKV